MTRRLGSTLSARSAQACAPRDGDLIRGDTGRTLHALRDNPSIAQSLGVDLTRARLDGVRHQLRLRRPGRRVYAILNGYISPQSFLAAKSIDILVGSIIGGSSSIGGAFIGAMFVVFVPDWASGISPALGASFTVSA